MRTKNGILKSNKAIKLQADSDLEKKKWLEQELGKCEFKDKRLGKRFCSLLERLWNGVGESIPFACQDWANTKAAYRFFSNDRVSEQNILSGHFQCTKERFSKTEGHVLVLQDTTEFSYQRENPDLIGITKRICQGKDLFGEPKHYIKCGMLMHSGLVVTTEGLPLGLASIKFWTRKKFKGCNALKRHVNPTRIPIEKKESFRWLESLKQSTELLNNADRCVHVGDRESDIYELFCTAQQMNTHFLVRTCVDRLSGDGNHTIANEMKEVRVKGLHRIEVKDKNGHASEAILEIKYRRIKVLPPIGKQKKYPDLWLTVIHAQERKKPKNREKIVWRLMTDLPVVSRRDAIEKLAWYSMRWKIETFHKILKSGCKAESSKLRTAERLVNLIAVFCIISWRIFWITMINRVCPEASPKLALRTIEMKLLNFLVKDSSKNNQKSKKLSDYIHKIAQLGGYLARSSDPPPGNMVIWRGLSRLTDLELGFHLAKKCG